jgi:hypothetical protein
MIKEPRYAHQLLLRGALASVIDLLLEVRLLRLEQRGAAHKHTCFDTSMQQRVPSESAALDLLCTLVQPLSAWSRRLFCRVILPGVGHIEEEPPLCPHKQGEGAYDWDTVSDGRTAQGGQAQWAPSSWAAPVDLGRLLLHFEADSGASAAELEVAAECVVTPYLLLSFV